MKNVVIVGSLNMDTVIKLDRFPRPGETLHGLEQFKFPGGKGLNQATALARLGDKVILIGMVGQDREGQCLIDGLNHEGVDTQFIGISDEVFTGNAVILVNKSGDNEIIVMHGANKKVEPQFIDKLRSIITAAGFLLIQFEVPLETVAFLIRLAGEVNVPVIINPSPYYPIEDQLIDQIDYLVLNENEAGLLLNMKIDSTDKALEAVLLIRQKGVKNVILTMGEQGAVYIDETRTRDHLPAYSVKVVDTTAAGDAFLGGLLHALMQNCSLKEAIDFANAVGALTASKIGAQSSLPKFDDVQAFLAANRQSAN